MWVTDKAGIESERRTATVIARHLPPKITYFVCTPGLVEPTKDVTCNLNYSNGTTLAQTLTMDWGDGTSMSGAVSGGSAVRVHQYHTATEKATDDRDYTITATIVDLAFEQDSASDMVQVRTILPGASISCTPQAFYERESTSCTVTSNAGTFAVDSTIIDWGDGKANSRVAGTEQTTAHVYAPYGSYTARGYSKDRRGNLSPASAQNLNVAQVILPSACTLSCAENPVPSNRQATCTLSYTQGSYALDKVEWDYDGNSTAEVTNDKLTWAFTPCGGVQDRTCNVGARLTDGGGNSCGWATTPITVGPPVQDPTVTLNCPATAQPGQTVTCTATADPKSGTVVEYEAGCTSTNAIPATSSNNTYSFTCTWPTEGTQSPRGRVKNSYDLWSNWVSDPVTVEYPVPVVSCSPTPSSVRQLDPQSATITFDGKGGTVSSVAWYTKFGGADKGGSSATVNQLSGTHPATGLPTDQVGTYTVYVSAVGSGGKTGNGQCNYTVTQRPIPTGSCSLSKTTVGKGATGETFTCQGLVTPASDSVRINAKLKAPNGAETQVCNPATERGLGNRTCTGPLNTSQVGTWTLTPEIVGYGGGITSDPYKPGPYSYTVEDNKKWMCETQISHSDYGGITSWTYAGPGDWAYLWVSVPAPEVWFSVEVQAGQPSEYQWSTRLSLEPLREYGAIGTVTGSGASAPSSWQVVSPAYGVGNSGTGHPAVNLKSGPLDSPGGGDFLEVYFDLPSDPSETSYTRSYRLSFRSPNSMRDYFDFDFTCTK
jgi:hypothetical protein